MSGEKYDCHTCYGIKCPSVGVGPVMKPAIPHRRHSRDDVAAPSALGTPGLHREICAFSLVCFDSAESLARASCLYAGGEGNGSRNFITAVGCSTGSYDFILVDPPWENKSAKRKRSYATLSRDELLLALPLSRLACPEGCLVAVWCTFNAAHLDFVVRRLLPSWGLPYLTTWYWVKVSALCLSVVLVRRVFCCR